MRRKRACRGTGIPLGTEHGFSPPMLGMGKGVGSERGKPTPRQCRHYIPPRVCHQACGNGWRRMARWERAVPESRILGFALRQYFRTVGMGKEASVTGKPVTAGSFHLTRVRQQTSVVGKMGGLETGLGRVGRTEWQVQTLRSGFITSLSVGLGKQAVPKPGNRRRQSSYYLLPTLAVWCSSPGARVSEGLGPAREGTGRKSRRLSKPEIYRVEPG